MPVYERLNMVVSLTLIGLALYFVIDFPTQILDPTLFGASVEIVASTRLLMVVLLGALAFTGAGAVVHSHPLKRMGYTIPFWVNPMLIVVLSTLTLAQLGGATNWAIGLLVTGTALWFTILAEYEAIEPAKGFHWAVLWSEGMSFALMLIYAVLIHQSDLSILSKMITIAGLGWLLSASIFKLTLTPHKSSHPFSFLIALALGQITWVLSYYPLGPVQIGLIILMVFYVLSGLVNTYLSTSALSKRVAVEYTLVAALGLVLIKWLERL
jgi:hypothetical protein